MINEKLADEDVTLRPTVVEVDLSRISANLAAIRSRAKGKKVMCILKANAYGHGLIKIAQHLESLGADYFGVAYLEEGIMLRRDGITTPILVMGGIIGNQIPHFIEYDLTITASSVDKLQQIEATAQEMNKKARVHLKIDTGMERIGMHYYSAERLIEAASIVSDVQIEGIFSHFANADEVDQSYTEMQMKRFKKVLQLLPKYNLDIPLIHIANSGGLLQISSEQYSMVRAGLLLYGVYPAAHLRKKIEVKPALSWKTRVVFFKVVKPGHPVSYGSTWQSDEMIRVVTLPVGYGDGYMRSMSNKAMVIINGQKYHNVGNICMDQLMINIKWGTAYNGDAVILIGEQAGNMISVEDLAEWAGTIPYEILTNINTRVPRVYK